MNGSANICTRRFPISSKNKKNRPFSDRCGEFPYRFFAFSEKCRFWGQAHLIFLIEFAQQIRNAGLSGRRALQVSKEFAYVGVLTVFETRKGIEKMPVVLTGKSKLHVFPLRRAKGNKACILCRFSPFFTVSEMFLSTLFKKKKLPYRECVEGKPSLAGLPLFSPQSPGLWGKFTLFGAHCV